MPCESALVSELLWNGAVGVGWGSLGLRGGVGLFRACPVGVAAAQIAGFLGACVMTVRSVALPASASEALTFLETLGLLPVRLSEVAPLAVELDAEPLTAGEEEEEAASA